MVMWAKYAMSNESEQLQPHENTIAPISMIKICIAKTGSLSLFMIQEPVALFPSEPLFQQTA